MNPVKHICPRHLSWSMVRIEFLGSGNAFLPQGRYHSLLMLDESLLIDAPPTLLASLRRRELSPADIRTVMITHWHGDHVFGFPFLLLERKYISDRQAESRLSVHSPVGGEDKLRHLCELAYPGSLDDRLSENVDWDESENGEVLGMSEWSFERFRVLHDENVDPHGYLLHHESGLRLMHTGDSGPCEAITSRARDCDVVVIELGVPDHVHIPHHFRPQTLSALANSCPDTTFLATHTYADDPQSGREPSLTDVLPVLPPNVVQVRDEDAFDWSAAGLVEL